MLWWLLKWLSPPTQEAELLVRLEEQAKELRELKDLVQTIAGMKATQEVGAPLQCANGP